VSPPENGCTLARLECFQGSDGRGSTSTCFGLQQEIHYARLQRFLPWWGYENERCHTRLHRLADSVTRLEDIKSGTSVRGISPDGLVKVVGVEWYGDGAIKVVYEDGGGTPGSRLIYRDEESTVEVASTPGHWSFDGDGALLRLVSEANRIRLAHLFDPYLAVHTSRIEPLPHQITAVYAEMLQRQPLRFLLADDPGAGKTIMTGLLIKELMVRGDLERCLVIAPGNLVEQWQDELIMKFGLSFAILTREHVETSVGNSFEEHPLMIARLDMLSRNEDLKERLTSSPEYDLIVVDEAHKMSASYIGGKAEYTKRYHLGETVRNHCRHFLLLSATPHSGKQDDFELFMALLDEDRFEGKPRAGVHKADTRDLMRRQRSLGRIPEDVSSERGIGYDIESKDPETGTLYFIEVKGKWEGRDDLVLTKNEILCSRNEPERFRLAIVIVSENGSQSPRYLIGYDFGEPVFAQTATTFSLRKQLQASGEPV
jgi:hypothetical protein